MHVLYQNSADCLEERMNAHILQVFKYFATRGRLRASKRAPSDVFCGVRCIEIFFIIRIGFPSVEFKLYIMRSSLQFDIFWPIQDNFRTVGTLKDPQEFVKTTLIANIGAFILIICDTRSSTVLLRSCFLGFLWRFKSLFYHHQNPRLRRGCF